MSKRCFWFETSENSYCFDLGNVFLFLLEPQTWPFVYRLLFCHYNLRLYQLSERDRDIMLTVEGHVTHVNVKLYEIGVFQDIVNTLK